MALLIYIRTTLSRGKAAVLLLNRNTGALVPLGRRREPGVLLCHISLEFCFCFCFFRALGICNFNLKQRKREEY